MEENRGSGEHFQHDTSKHGSSVTGFWGDLPLDSAPPGLSRLSGGGGRLLSPRIASMVCRGPGCCGCFTWSPLNNILVVTSSGALESLLSASIAWRRLAAKSYPLYPLHQPSSVKKDLRTALQTACLLATEFSLSPPMYSYYIKDLDGGAELVKKGGVTSPRERPMTQPCEGRRRQSKTGMA